MAFSHPHQTRVTPRWCPPPPSAIKLNFDDSASSNPGYAGVGGVIRNTETTLLSYSGPAGFCSSNKAELLLLESASIKRQISTLNGHLLKGTPIASSNGQINVQILLGILGTLVKR